MTKYFRYILKGKHSPETATAALGPTAANGLIVHVNARDDENGRDHGRRNCAARST